MHRFSHSESNLSCLTIYNQFTEQFSVNDLAKKVQKALQKIDIDVKIKKIKNPRIEKEKHYYNASNKNLKKLGLKSTLLSDNTIIDIAKYVLKHKRKINKKNNTTKSELVMRVVITGFGFIELILLSIYYQKTNKNIIVVDSFQNTDLKNISEITKFKYFENSKKYKKSNHKVVIIKNVLNSKFAEIITKKNDIIVHLAAESGVDISITKPKDSFKNNVVGAFNYLACEGKMVLKDSFSLLGAVFETLSRL